MCRVVKLSETVGSMRAARFKEFGPVEVLEVVDLPEPTRHVDTAVIRVEAASVNPSDIKNVSGAMAQTTLPRVPGRDYAGVVESGPANWVGARVWGTGGDVGFTRDSTHAEHVAVPAASLSRMPERLSFEEAASVGVNFVTAWCGLVEAAGLRGGETVLVIGAGGGVGGAAVQIARHLGATVIGSARVPPPKGAAILAGPERLLIGPADLSGALREATGSRGVDVVFDTVGGAMFRTALACLACGGRLIEITAAGQREAHFDLADFYHNESRLFGIDTLKRDTITASLILNRLSAGFAAGDYRPPPIAAVLPLSQVVEAYRLVTGGTNGRIVLHTQQ